jgi:multiple sugar transport system permease protein
MGMVEGAQGSTRGGSGLEPTVEASKPNVLMAQLERRAPAAFVLPAVLVVLFLSIFPLILSLYFSLIHLTFVPGGFKLNFVGLDNYARLLLGLNREETLGVPTPATLPAWIAFGIITAVAIGLLVRYAKSQGSSVSGVVGRSVVSFLLLVAAWLMVFTVFPGGRPGALVVTLLYVIIGISAQYLLGLGLANLCVQHVPGRRFFRVLFLIPMMITPVGVAYLFRMLTDTIKGPFTPFWYAVGLGGYSWVTDAWGARFAVIIGDTWQWTPFMFIVLLAALESQSVEQIEAAVVDGASQWQVFWNITFPQLLPVSATLILIRMIEAFKIIDLPNVLTNGGPGTATESLTLQAYIYWRNLDIGGSAALAYILLFVVTFAGIAYVNLIHSRAAAAG